MIRFLIEKEIKQILRNNFLPKMVFIFPVMMMILFPNAATLDMKNINLVVVDHSHDAYSRRLVEKINSSGYFVFQREATSYADALSLLEYGRADVILEIPEGMERYFIRENVSPVLIAVNTVNGTKGILGSSYMNTILRDFNEELFAESGKSIVSKPITQIDVLVRNRFNPFENYKLFMIPVLMVITLTMICGYLPAMNIVSEKEKGTIEQINVTPVSKFSFIVAKLFPFWLSGFIVLTNTMLLAWIIYGIIPAGSIPTIYLLSLLYVLCISGFGLIISNSSQTVQQAMFVTFFFMMIFMLMSGLFTPITAMPSWAKVIAYCSPLTYFNIIMRSIYIKGSGLIDLIPEVVVLISMACIFNTWAVLGYRKKS